MQTPLNPALAVIFIQYSRGTLQRPYSDFERFEIFTTLLEELDPFQSYEVHEARIASDARSAVIASTAVRMELYERWVGTAWRARRKNDAGWNHFIAFVNAQLKFHTYLNYEQFCYLCDDMAGFRLSPLSDNRKQSLFWGCVLRREWRFAYIQRLIDQRERMEEFVGPVVGAEAASGTESYAARVGRGLRLPVVPKSAAEVRQQAAAPARDDSPSDGWPSASSTPPNAMKILEQKFAHARDVVEVINMIYKLENGYAEGIMDENDLSTHMLRVGAMIREPSRDMKLFGRCIQHQLVRLEGKIAPHIAILFDALLNLALAAQGIAPATSEAARCGRPSAARAHQYPAKSSHSAAAPASGPSPTSAARSGTPTNKAPSRDVRNGSPGPIAADSSASAGDVANGTLTGSVSNSDAVDDEGAADATVAGVVAVDTKVDAVADGVEADDVVDDNKVGDVAGDVAGGEADEATADNLAGNATGGGVSDKVTTGDITASNSVASEVIAVPLPLAEKPGQEHEISLRHKPSLERKMSSSPVLQCVCKTPRSTSVVPEQTESKSFVLVSPPRRFSSEPASGEPQTPRSQLPAESQLLTPPDSEPQSCGAKGQHMTLDTPEVMVVKSLADLGSPLPVQPAPIEVAKGLRTRPESSTAPHSPHSPHSQASSSIAIPIYRGHMCEGPNGPIYIDGPFNPELETSGDDTLVGV